MREENLLYNQGLRKFWSLSQVNIEIPPAINGKYEKVNKKGDATLLLYDYHLNKPFLGRVPHLTNLSLIFGKSTS